MRSLVIGFVSMVFGLAGAGVARADEEPGGRATGDVCLATQRQAETDQQQGRLLVARDQLDACAKQECAEQVRTTCAQRRDELDARIPTVAFAVRDGLGHDLDAIVTIDGNATPVPLGRTTRLDPGIHEVRWKSSTSPARDGLEKLTVFEGQRNRVVALTAETETPPVVTRSAASHDVWPWFVVGAGGLFVATATVFELVALREDSERKALDLTLRRNDLSSVEQETFRSARESHHEAANTNEAVAITVGIVGIVAIATGVTWGLVREQGPRSANVRLAPKVAGTGLGFAF